MNLLVLSPYLISLMHDYGLPKTVFHSITFLFVRLSIDLNLTVENIHNFVGNLKRSTKKYIMLRNWLNIFKYDEAILMFVGT